MTQLGAQDAQFLHADTQNSFANVATILIYGPPIGSAPRLDLESLIEHVRSRLHTSPIFRRRVQRVPLDLDYPYWVDEEHFDVENHVQYSALPKPGTWRQFTHFASKFHGKPMDMNRPLWEICMVDGLDEIEGVPRGSFALILKAHHAAIDGTTGLQFFACLSDSDEHGTPAVSLDTQAPSAGGVPQAGAMLTRALLNNVRSPIRLIDSLRRAVPSLLPAVWRTSRGDDAPRPSGVPDTRFNRPVSPRKQFDACWFPLAAFKGIKQRVEGATINDVVLAVCGGALRKYLESHGELPRESLVAWVPINTRPRELDAGEITGNEISTITVGLGTDVRDPYERLAIISRQTRRSKEAKAGIPARALTEISRHFPAYTLALVTRLIMKANLIKPLGNLMVTNVPGPQVPLYVKGSPCLRLLGLTPIGEGMALCIGTPSYNGQIAFIVMSTPAITPDIEFLVQCITAAFHEFDRPTRSRGATEGTRRPRARKVAS